MGFQKRSLIQQGYSNLTSEQLNSLQWGLRFTPTICMLGAVYGLATHNPILLFVLAGVGIVPFWFPSHHPLDRLYNSLIAPALGAMQLPANPLPRRIACLSGGAMNVLAATAFLLGAPTAAYLFGGILIALQLMVNLTHFCVASFGIEMMLRAVGKSLPSTLIDGTMARELINQGAHLIDVRDASEYAMGSLPGSRNLPLGELADHVEALLSDAQPVVLYCQSGGRSKLAHGLLAQRGLCGLHNLGGIDRW